MNSESEAKDLGVTGTVYLIHFDRSFSHARHYIGWTRNLEGRLWYHRNGAGSRLLAAVNRAGIGWHVVRTWEGTGNFERKLHRRKNSAKLCPVCNTGRKGEKEEAQGCKKSEVAAAA